MRIVSWNIQHGGGRRVAGLTQHLTALAPDICVLVEYRAVPSSRALRHALAAQGLTHAIESLGADATGLQNGLLIASRWPLTYLPVTFPGAPALRWLLAAVAAPSPLTIGAVHVPNRDEKQEDKYACLNSLVTLARDWPYGPGLLVGDYNTGRRGLDETTDFFNATEDRFMAGMAQASWADAFRHWHGAARRYSWWRRSRGSVSAFRLDHAFISPALLPHLEGCDLVHAEAGWPSDHAALVVDLAEMN